MSTAVANDRQRVVREVRRRMRCMAPAVARTDDRVGVAMLGTIAINGRVSAYLATRQKSRGEFSTSHQKPAGATNE